MQAQSRRELVVDVAADLICPWCYIGLQRVAAAVNLARAEVPVVVRHYPFELNPAMPVGGMPRRDYRSAKFGSWERSLELDAHVMSVAVADGLTMNLEAQSRTPSTFRAHCLLLRYRETGAAGALLDALYRAYFVEAHDIGRVDVLLDVASAVGIEDPDLEGALQSGAHAEVVRAEVDAAYAAGIAGVPAVFADGRILAQGAEPPARLAARLRAAAVPAA